MSASENLSGERSLDGVATIYKVQMSMQGHTSTPIDNRCRCDYLAWCAHTDRSSPRDSRAETDCRRSESETVVLGGWPIASE